MRLITALIASILLLSIRVPAQEFSVPVLVGQTGAAATFGKAELDAYTLAAEEWNARGGIEGQKVKLVVEDTQTKQQQLLSGFQRLMLLNPSFVLGPTWLDSNQGLIPLARQKKVLLVTPSAAREAFSDENRDWPITFYHNSTLEITTLLQGLSARGLNKIAMFYEQEPFSEMIRKLVLEAGTKLNADVGVQAGESDFKAILAKMRLDPPQALLLLVWDDRSMLSLLQQVRTYLPNVVPVTLHDGDGWKGRPEFKGLLPRLVYTKFLVADKEFSRKFKQRFGYEPMLTASNAYDGMNAVLTAIAAGHKTEAEIRDYLLNQKLTTVTFGKFNFSSDGSVPSLIEVVQD
ncbi:MAG: ABC transporter substrate-binding protein [Oligoflexia bacterium]|nr:ABC transporter substrate-binding protein [Oligoflexia bacterium]